MTWSFKGRRGVATPVLFAQRACAVQLPQLDDKLLTLTNDFVREYCGIDMPPAPPR